MFCQLQNSLIFLLPFKSFCPCHSKNGLNSEFKPFFCYVCIRVCSTFSTVFLPKNRMKCFKIHRICRVHHQNSITFLGAKPAQKSADILIKIPQHLRMALRSFALSLFTAQHILIYKCVLLNILYISHSLIILQFNFQNGLFTLINRTKGSFANLHLINITAVFFVN